jgi:heme/copper-type cytochrome/quinol oxidase subunit 2
MLWFVVYASVAIVVAGIASAVTSRLRTGDGEAAAQWGPAALLAGVLWPIALIGLVQLFIMFVVSKGSSVLGSVWGLTRV